MLIPINDVPDESFNPETLGGKGYGLAWMVKNQITVPPALILPTSVCLRYRKAPKTTMAEIKKLLPKIRLHFQESMGYMPLLSIRSGARVSMPGMMDTILNVGLDKKTFGFWEKMLGTETTQDCQNRLATMYAKVVMGFEGELDFGNVVQDYQDQVGTALPDTNGQILGAIEAVFKSWNNERAKVYRKLNNIPEEWGTACVIQAMVFGNAGPASCTGVLFTRNPDTGENTVVGEWLPEAQGEDVVDGSHTPRPLEAMVDWNPAVYGQLYATALRLEELRGDVQDVEFTVQEGKLYILQTRNAKRSAIASLKIALDRGVPLKEIPFKDFLKAQQDQIDPNFKTTPWATGLPACSGVVSGKVVFTAKAAVEAKEPVILVAEETNPDDIAGMHAARGVLTLRGGTTSHAAVVARAMNVPCVVGLEVTLDSFVEDETISFDGSTGRVWKCEVPVISGQNHPVIAEMERRLYADSGCLKLGDEKAAFMSIDCTTVNALSAAAGIREALESHPTVIVNILHQPGVVWPAWASIVGVINPHKYLNELWGLFSDQEMGRLYFLAVPELKDVPSRVQLIATPMNLEDLILTKSKFVLPLNTPPTPEIQRVLKWQEADGNHPLRVNVVEPGAYANLFEVAQELLG